MITMWITKRWTVLGSRSRHGATFTCTRRMDEEGM